VVTVDLRLNTPRHAALPAIMKARSKPLVRMEPLALGVDLKPRLEVIGVEAPAERPKGTMVASVAELVAKLRTEARVL
jgi:electron transfer flavoprotein beta subunit